ncbi:MAG: sulfite exporter TauE/SafE family protein [Gammaproteobacteria bacterium]|nr:sulfite exporter TauE/SafE family protein [Gammaproteobacteria bacterium]MCH9715875.1 sulfite exporter TauE/SafE family protein [Gammaproteobacteria bacterium]MCH9763701.1 sulfite exporter TauE/SafE family protein [Gammaproteobacteria bacterium]
MAFGFFLAMVMGIVLGFIGSGGSMLTVPIVVYFFGFKPFIATGYSLLVVGCTAAVGTFSYWRRGLVRARDTFAFVLPSTITILLTRRFIVPAIPDPVMTINQLNISKGLLIMVLFSLLMLLAGWLILKPVTPRKINQQHMPKAHPIPLVLGSGMVGLLAGLVGAGGGFLIIPVLITWFDFSMKEAIGTSLAVIMLNSLIGFQGDLLAGIDIDWHILGPFLGLAILGMFLGVRFNQHVDGPALKRLFGFFMLCLGGVILLAEGFSLLR